jgi:ABC-type multidrug transport system ATPase subunit
MSIEVVGLSCRGQGGYGLRDVSLSVPEGSACLLAGPNGGGKSLLLAALAGLVRPTAGRLTVAGHDLLRRPSAARRALGYVPQIPAAFAGLTVEEHVEFLARCHGLRGKERDESVATLLDVVGLLDAARVEAAALTPGQQRRLALAGAMVHHPPVLLLDTPFAGLDVAGRDEMIAVLDEVRALGATLLLAADRPAEALPLCDLAAVLDGGTLRWSGPAAELPEENGGRPAAPVAAAAEQLADEVSA